MTIQDDRIDLQHIVHRPRATNSRLELVKVQICQIQLHAQCLIRREDGLFEVQRRESLTRQLRRALKVAGEHRTNLLVFPELALPYCPRIHKSLRTWSEQHNAVVVASTNYTPYRPSCRPLSQCHVYIDGEDYVIEKITPSPLQKSIGEEERISPGRQLKIIHGTPAGTLAVLICSDALDPHIMPYVIGGGDVDILCVPAMQRDPASHHDALHQAVWGSHSGLYIAYANALCPTVSGGKSAFFGLAHSSYLPQFRTQHLTNGMPSSKLLVIPDCGKNAVVSFDLSQKRPIVQRDVKADPNVSWVFKDFHYDTAAGRDRPNNRHYNPTIDIVAFDLDGTLIRGMTFSWELIWRHMGLPDDGRQRFYTNYRARCRERPDERVQHYQQWCTECCVALRRAGLTKEHIRDACSKLTPTRHLEIVLTKLRQQRKHIMLISGGIETVARQVLGERILALFDEVHINTLSFDDSGHLSHIRPTAYDFEGKLDALRNAAYDRDCTLENVCFVGDQHNDRVALDAVHVEGGLAIAYGDAPLVNRDEVGRIIRTDDLTEVLQAIERRRGQTRRGAKPLDSMEKQFCEAEDAVHLKVAFRAIVAWAEELSREQPRVPGVLNLVTHDQLHRKRVWSVLSQLIVPILEIHRNPTGLSFLASCAAATHDLGLWLDLDNYIPGAARYDEQERAAIYQERHHQMIGRELGRLARGPLPNLVEVAIRNEGLNGNERQKAIAAFTEACRLLQVLHGFQGGQLNDVYVSEESALAVCEASRLIGLSQDDIRHLRAAIDLADRMDRHEGRLVDPSQRLNLLQRASDERTASSVPGVVLDCLLTEKAQITLSPYRYINLRYEVASKGTEEEQQLQAALFQARILDRMAHHPPACVRVIEEGTGYRFHTSHNLPSGRGVVPGPYFAIRPARRAAPTVDQLVDEVLGDCPKDSWIKLAACSSLWSGGKASRLISPRPKGLRTALVGMIYNCQTWKLKLASTPLVVQTECLFKHYQFNGHAPRRIALLRTPMKPEWDIFIPICSPTTGRLNAVVNVHVPPDVEWSKEQAQEYGSVLYGEMRRWSNRLCIAIAGERENVLNRLSNDCFANGDERIHRAMDVVEIPSRFALPDIAEAALANCKGRGTVNADVMVQVKESDMNASGNLLGMAVDESLFLIACESVIEAFGRIGPVSVAIGARRKLPLNYVEVSIDDTASQELNEVAQLGSLCEKSGYDSSNAITISENSQRLAAAYEYARINGCNFVVQRANGRLTIGIECLAEAQ